VVSASPGVTHRLCALGPGSPPSQGASATQAPHPSTTRRGRQLSSINRLQQPSSTFCISDQAITPYHNPLNPTTSVDFLPSLALALSSCPFGSPLRLSISTQHIFQSPFRHPIQKLAATAASILSKSILAPDLIYPKLGSLTLTFSSPSYAGLGTFSVPYSTSPNQRLRCVFFVAFAPIGLEWALSDPQTEAGLSQRRPRVSLKESVIECQRPKLL
jgi:hypothetical protein